MKRSSECIKNKKTKRNEELMKKRGNKKSNKKIFIFNKKPHEET